MEQWNNHENRDNENKLIKPLIKKLVEPIIKFDSQPSLVNPLIKGTPVRTDICVERNELESQCIEALVLPQLTAASEMQLGTFAENSQSVMVEDLKPIYVSASKQSDQYIKQVETKRTAHDIAEYIKSLVAIKSLDGNLYVFNRFLSVYEHYDNNRMSILIDCLAKEEIVKIGNSGAYREVINYLKYDHTIAIKEEKALPNNVWAYNNCFVDIYIGKTAPNDGRYFITSTLQCNFNSNAFCPIFDEFIFSVAGGEPNLIELIWEIIGYTLSSDMNAKSFFTFIGPKDTGKSLLINVIQSFFLPDCVSGLGIADFGVKFALEELTDKRLNICADLTDENIPPRAVGTIKILTGGDLARTERKFKSAKKFYCTAKLIFSANYSIRLEKPDEAFTERQVRVPFLYPVPKERQDKRLLSRLRNELSGIAVKAMEAYKRLVINNYVFPEVLKGQLPEGMIYDEEKIMVDFVESFCDFSDVSAKIFTQDIYDAYQTFCMRQKVQAIADIGGFSASFNRIVKERAERKKVNIKGKILQGYVGIKLT